MKYVITGSLGKVSRPLTQKLVAAGHDVTVISRDPGKKEEIELLGAKAAIGSVEDIRFLSDTFSGAVAVYTMVPPNFGAADMKKFIAATGSNLATAIKLSGVRYVVNLSSVGAHLPDGCGPVSGLFYVEKALDQLEDVHVRHLRPGFFYQNFLTNIGMIRHMGIIGGNYDENTLMMLVEPADIAEVAAEELQNLSFQGKSHRYVASDEKKASEIASILGTSIGKPDLKWIGFTDEETYGGMVQNGLPPNVAQNYTEMGAALRSGIMGSLYFENRPGKLGKTKLEDFAAVFARIYHKG